MKSLWLPAYRGTHQNQIGYAAATFAQVSGVNPTVAAHVVYSAAVSQEMTWSGAVSRGWGGANIYAWYLQHTSGSGSVLLRLQVRQGLDAYLLPELSVTPVHSLPPFASRILLGTLPLEGPFQIALGRNIVDDYTQSFRVAGLEVAVD